MREKRIIIILLIAIIAILSTSVYMPKHVNKSGILLENEGRDNRQFKPIMIFGFSELHMVSGKKTQEFAFYNKNSNNCYMNIELLLPDGEQLFEIKRIEPGYGIQQVQLNKVLENNDYLGCRFIIKCFSMENETELNGATMNVNLYVR